MSGNIDCLRGNRRHTVSRVACERIDWVAGGAHRRRAVYWRHRPCRYMFFWFTALEIAGEERARTGIQSKFTRQAPDDVADLPFIDECMSPKAHNHEILSRQCPVPKKSAANAAGAFALEDPLHSLPSIVLTTP